MKVLVLCHRNQFRSPACAAVIKGEGLDVQSAGFKANNLPAAKKVRDLMSKSGYDLSSHRSQIVTRNLVDWADKIVIMDGGNERRLKSKKFDCMHKVKKLGDVIGIKRIPDPAFMPIGSSELSNTIQLIIKASKLLAEEFNGNSN